MEINYQSYGTPSSACTVFAQPLRAAPPGTSFVADQAWEAGTPQQWAGLNNAQVILQPACCALGWRRNRDQIASV